MALIITFPKGNQVVQGQNLTVTVNGLIVGFNLDFGFVGFGAGTLHVTSDPMTFSFQVGDAPGTYTLFVKEPVSFPGSTYTLEGNAQVQVLASAPTDGTPPPTGTVSQTDVYNIAGSNTDFAESPLIRRWYVAWAGTLLKAVLKYQLNFSPNLLGLNVGFSGCSVNGTKVSTVNPDTVNVGAQLINGVENSFRWDYVNVLGLPTLGVVGSFNATLEVTYEATQAQIDANHTTVTNTNSTLNQPNNQPSTFNILTQLPLILQSAGTLILFAVLGYAGFKVLGLLPQRRKEK